MLELETMGKLVVMLIKSAVKAALTSARIAGNECTTGSLTKKYLADIVVLMP